MHQSNVSKEKERITFILLYLGANYAHIWTYFTAGILKREAASKAITRPVTTYIVIHILTQENQPGKKMSPCSREALGHPGDYPHFTLQVESRD